jgi:DNA-binding CsgD family transcriptional regulator
MALVSTAPTAVAGELLERDGGYATLETAWAAAQAGEGRLVLVSGDAGIGKSALVRAFCARVAGEARVLTGACDGLWTPRPLGPLADIAATVGGGLGDAVAAGVPASTVFEALVRELRSTRSTVVVLEDVHLADEATLDILGLLGRRVEQLGVLILATYRTDELTRTHPLRIVVGELATVAGVGRLQLEPLSRDAVATLAAPHGVDAGELHAKTDGNPFFVTEVLASGSTDVPATVRDAVLARIARLGSPARDLLDAVAVVPQRAELWLLEALAGDALGSLEECLASGVLRIEGRAVAFRHELARLVVEESIDPHRRSLLHCAALRALREPPDGRLDLARLAHHAEAAGDGTAVLELAPRAAERAAAVGAHREAAAQYARALRHADGLPPMQRAALLELRSFECYTTGKGRDAIADLEEALACYREIGDARRAGICLCSLFARRWCESDMAGAESAVIEAVAVLEPLGPSPELTMAYASGSALAMNEERTDDALALGERALALIDEANMQTLVYQLNNSGTAALLQGRAEGLAQLERSIALAADAGLEVDVGRGYLHLAWVAVRTRDFALMTRLAEGIEYCTEHGLELWRLYLLAYRSRLELDQGRWTEAADSASFVLGQAAEQPLVRLLALTTLASVRARRGDPDTRSLLDEALSLAPGAPDLQHRAPIAIALTEAAAYAGRSDLAAQASDAVLALALERGATWVAGELALWRRQAGIEDPCPEGVAEPFTVHLSGDWRAAAALWERLGCPYEAALALGHADDAATLRRSLEQLQQLGAGPAAASVGRRLRQRGEQGLARGPRPSTRENPAGLTSRQLEVLELLAQGLRNAEIAERLVLSHRTVDHHVAATLQKLGARTRAEASAHAVRLGLAGKDR